MENQKEKAIKTPQREEDEALFCIMQVREEDPNIAYSFVNYMTGSLPLNERKTASIACVPGTGGKFFFEADDLIMVQKSRLDVFDPETDTVFATKEVSKAILTFFEKYGRSVQV